MYQWVLQAVEAQQWMQDLRHAGVGSQRRGRSEMTTFQLKNVIKKWTKNYNKHNTHQIEYTPMVDFGDEKGSPKSPPPPPTAENNKTEVSSKYVQVCSFNIFKVT